MHKGLLEDQGVFDIGNPGMGLRLTPQTINQLKNSM